MEKIIDPTSLMGIGGNPILRKASFNSLWSKMIKNLISLEVIIFFFMSGLTALLKIINLSWEVLLNLPLIIRIVNDKKYPDQ